MPKFQVDRAVGRALKMGFRKNERPCYAITVGVDSVKITVSLRSPQGARITQRAIDRLVARLKPWSWTAAAYVVALAHKRPEWNRPLQPVRLSVLKIAQGLGLAGPGKPLRARDRQHVLDVLQLLQLLHVEGSQVITQDDVRRCDPIDSWYVLLSGVPAGAWRDITELTEIQIAPGRWSVGFAVTRNVYFAPIEERLFQLGVKRWRVTALGLYLAEVWRLNAQKGLDDFELTLDDVIARAGISKDGANARRFATALIRDLHQLVAYDVLAPPEDFPGVPTSGRTKWFATWGRSPVHLLPSDRIARALYAHVYSTRPFLDAPAPAEEDVMPSDRSDTSPLRASCAPTPATSSTAMDRPAA
jgi:hypothetical protein